MRLAHGGWPDLCTTVALLYNSLVYLTSIARVILAVDYHLSFSEHGISVSWLESYMLAYLTGCLCSVIIIIVRCWSISLTFGSYLAFEFVPFLMDWVVLLQIIGSVSLGRYLFVFLPS